jgi:hypothetical protein
VAASSWGNSIGVLANDASGTDLGTASDPGGNTIQDNTSGNLRFAANLTGGFVSAVGDTWNKDVQGANGFGAYVNVKFDGSSAVAHGKNFDLPSAAFSIQF